MRDNPPGQGVVEREYTFYSQKMQALFCIFLYFMDTVEFAMNKTVFLCNMPQEAAGRSAPVFTAEDAGWARL
jgi:hypothetical protein